MVRLSSVVRRLSVCLWVTDVGIVAKGSVLDENFSSCVETFSVLNLGDSMQKNTFKLGVQ